MLEASSIAVGLLIAFVVGLSKTGLPGAGILATPLIATIATGRTIPGATLPLLLIADLFAIAWYRRHARWDLLIPLTRWITVGFAAAILYFIVAGDNDRLLSVTIGVIVLVVVAMQTVKLHRPSNDHTPPADGSTPLKSAAFGAGGGFTTFVANAAGPIFSAFLVNAGVDKASFIGTSAWFYFLVNLAKIPFYLLLGELTAGGPFFTTETLAFAAISSPMVVVGAYLGRVLFTHLPQTVFINAVLLLAAVGAINLVVG